jgi:hypothetical protein
VVAEVFQTEVFEGGIKGIHGGILSFSRPLSTKILSY